MGAVDFAALYWLWGKREYMRWLKHLTAAHQDGEMDRILEECGAVAYGVFWLILEDIAGPMEGESMVPEATHSDQRWAQIARVDPRLWRKCKEALGKKLLRVRAVDGNRVCISAPNILKYKDEYSRKSGQTQALNGAEQNGAEQKKPAAAFPIAAPQLPQATAAARRKFPATDEAKVCEIADAARRVEPEATDVHIAEAIIICSMRAKKSAHFYVGAVPLVIRQVCARARDSPTAEQQEQQALEIAREKWLTFSAEERMELEAVWGLQVRSEQREGGRHAPEKQAG